MNPENVRRIIRSGLPLLFLLTPAISNSQSCNSTGADGAYSPSASGTFDPVALHLNTAGDNVFNFSSINIPSNVTITMQSHAMRAQRPVVFLVSGTVSIQGILNLSGANGQATTTQFYLRSPSEPGPGGYPGGAGARPSGKPNPGAGPGGAKAPTDNGNGCSASHTYVGVGGAGCANASAIYGDPLLLPFVGGSGGSGGGTTNPAYIGPSGGAGGGAIRICSNVSITANQIYANGGDGGTYASGTYWAGAGSGGAIHLQAPVVSLTYGGGGYIQAVGGSEQGTGATSVGRVRIDANSLTGGNTNPQALVGPFLAGSYGGVPLPTSPTLRVVSVGGVAVPAQPNNGYTLPDLAISSTAAVPIVLATTGIPNNTKATFYITTDSNFSPSATDIVSTQIIVNNAATLSVALPVGVNRIFVRAAF